MDLLEELRDDFLMCHICFEEYRDPKQLPCLHTFCRQCLSKYIVGKVVETGAEWFPCPFCRKAIQPTQGGEVITWADSFPTNFLLSQLSSKIKDKTALYCENLSDVTSDRDVGLRAKCAEHPHFYLVGYCKKQKKAVCEECCVHRHSDCIRKHVREQDSRLMAEERRAECQESLGALQIKLEGVKDKISARESELATRKEQLNAQTESVINDLRTKFDVFFNEQKRELRTKLENFFGKETSRLTTVKTQAAELTRSCSRVSKKLDSVEDAELTVRDLALLDQMQEELRRQEHELEKLRKDCLPMDVQFFPNSNAEKVLKGLTLGTLGVEHKSQASGGARPRMQRYTSDPSSSLSQFMDHDHSATLPAHRASPDVFDNAPPPRAGGKKGRALSPPGAAASALSSSPSTAEGPTSGDLEAMKEHKRRSEGTLTLSKKTPTVPDFGAVLIEESRRSRSVPRRPRLLSEGSSMAPTRRRGVPMETAIDGDLEIGRISERGPRPAERVPQPAPSRPTTETCATAATSSRPDRSAPTTPPTTATQPQQVYSEDDLSTPETSNTPVPSDSEGPTGASAGERDLPGGDSAETAGRKIVCVRHFQANHGSDVKNQPGLVGISAVCKDRVAVSDRWNKVVKLVDIGGRVMDVLAIPGDAEPWDLALRRPGVLAVTYPKEQKIRMVDVVDGGTRMYYRSHFMTRDGYASLATYDATSLLASVCPPFGSPKIHVIDYIGAVLLSIDSVNVAYPRCVDLCGTDEVCVSDWTHHSVKIFTRDGSVPKFCYSGVPGVSDAQLKAPMGVAWDGRGHIFIVDGKTSRLHAVCTQTGQCTAIFSLPQVAGEELKLVTFVDASADLCRSEKALVVTTTGGAVQVYDVCSPF